MLNCEQNTPEMKERIGKAAQEKFGKYTDEVSVIFDHEQFFVTPE